MDYPPWIWEFHGQVIEETGSEVVMVLSRCLARDKFQGQLASQWIEPAGWMDFRHKIVRIPKMINCDYTLTPCDHCHYFRRLGLKSINTSRQASFLQQRRRLRVLSRTSSIAGGSLNVLTTIGQQPRPWSWKPMAVLLLLARNSFVSSAGVVQ